VLTTVKALFSDGELISKMTSERGRGKVTEREAKYERFVLLKNIIE
jgi:hypothetical protein